jgi:hypothetical protein
LWQWIGTSEPDDESTGDNDTKPADVPKELKNILLPIVSVRGDSAALFDHQTKIRSEDSVYWVVFLERETEAEEWLRQKGWVPASADTPGEVEKQ